MTTAVDAPCAPFCDEADVGACGPCATLDPAPDSGLLTDMIEVASTWLWRLTARAYGVCPVTVLPLGTQSCFSACGTPWPYPLYAFFNRDTNCWVLPYYWNPIRVRQNRGEGCQEVKLGFANVQAVSEVRIDGVKLDPSAYRLDDARWLVRVDGAPWPYNDSCIDPMFEVDLTHGLPVPPDLKHATAALACELVLACSGDTACRLPRRVQNVTRQGVTMVLLDPMQLVSERRFGIAEVDYAIQTLNPTGRRMRSAVINVDFARASRVVGVPAPGP